MEFSLARTSSNALLVMGVFSVLGLFFAETDQTHLVALLGLFAAACFVGGVFVRRYCKCPHCGKSLAMYRNRPPRCPFCQNDLNPAA